MNKELKEKIEEVVKSHIREVVELQSIMDESDDAVS